MKSKLIKHILIVLLALVAGYNPALATVNTSGSAQTAEQFNHLEVFKSFQELPQFVKGYDDFLDFLSELEEEEEEEEEDDKKKYQKGKKQLPVGSVYAASLQINHTHYPYLSSDHYKIALGEQIPVCQSNRLHLFLQVLII